MDWSIRLPRSCGARTFSLLRAKLSIFLTMAAAKLPDVWIFSIIPGSLRNAR